MDMGESSKWCNAIICMHLQKALLLILKGSAFLPLIDCLQQPKVGWNGGNVVRMWQRPDGLMYRMFRNQFLAFSIYQSCVQFLQYYYQSGCLYRLRALGERNHLDLTVEGFQSWMWRGLTFLLPALFFGHFWQLYNAITLFELSRHEECKEWQISVLAFAFFLLFLGNFLTTLKVVHTKFQKNKLKKS